MNPSLYVVLWISAAVILANAPFVLPIKRAPGLWRLFLLALGYGLVLVLGFTLESDLGKTAGQTWPFYAVTVPLFLIFASFGFIWRYLYAPRPK